jgi:hypothetical protein
MPPAYLYFGIRGWRQTLDHFRRPSFRQSPAQLHKSMRQAFVKHKSFLILVSDLFKQTPLWRFIRYGFLILLGVTSVYVLYTFLMLPTYLVFDGKLLWTEHFLQQTVGHKTPYSEILHINLSDIHSRRSGNCYKCAVDIYDQSNQSIFRIRFSSETQAIQMRNKLLQELRSKGMHPR